MAGTRAITVIIANGAAASGAFDLNGYRILSIMKPADWTAGDISFEVETFNQSAAFVKVVDRAGLLYRLTGISTTVAECHLVGADVAGTTANGNVTITSPGKAKIVSTNTASEADVNQGAARTLIVIVDTVQGGF